MRLQRAHPRLGTSIAWALLVSTSYGQPFDHNGNGRVDREDYASFQACLTGPGLPADAACQVPHDSDDDQDIDLADFLEFLLVFDDPSRPTAVQLAGRPLADYPFFEFVSAFNFDEAVSIAVDPTRFPDVAGQPCDLYVVAARSRNAWMADSTLVDVRAGGPDTITFSGTTIQDNVVTVATAGQLSADAGIDIGVGYDIVLDLDRDGILGLGDHIDGHGDEAGCYVLGDLTAPGPLAVTSTDYSGGPFLEQRAWYPTNIAAMGQLPLIVISHGNGHEYTWYDYLQSHLASYGYVVMSHANNTAPGIESAAQTTLTNTDYFLGHYDEIAGGLLAGHIDSTRIVWIGHSRGAEGVVRAFVRIDDGGYLPQHFDAADLAMISSIAPTDFLGPGLSTPRSKPYHHLWGSADGDVTGSTEMIGTRSWDVYGRATGPRQTTFIHGADHNDFNCCGWDDFAGEEGTAIGREEAQQVAKAVYLALVKHYVEGNIPARDLLWRQWERFRPVGVSSDTTVVSQYTLGPQAGSTVIDNFQAEPDPGVSSSGGTVLYDVSNVHEGVLCDVEWAFEFLPEDPMHGMTEARTTDFSAGIVFDYAAGTQRHMTFEVPAALRDFSHHKYLSFRACQGAQHPYTEAVEEDLTFSVSLIDGQDGVSTIGCGAYGGGIEEPYERPHQAMLILGDWQNEWETIRIRLTDFVHNGAAIDLEDVAAIRFNFGSDHGSAEGRLGLDDLELTVPYLPRRLGLNLASELTVMIVPGVSPVVRAQVSAIGEQLVPGTARVRYRYDGITFHEAVMTLVEDQLYQATLPPVACGDVVEFYLIAEGGTTGALREPTDAPGQLFSMEVGRRSVDYGTDFESDPGWTVSGDAIDGPWELGVPAGTGDRADPPADYDGSGRCYLTDNEAGNTDVDEGTTTLTSAVFDLSTLTDPWVSYALWYSNSEGGAPMADTFTVEVSDDGGATWVTLETVGPAGPYVHGGWWPRSFEVAAFVDVTDQFMIRWHACDLGEGSLIEAGLDAFEIFEKECP